MFNFVNPNIINYTEYKNGIQSFNTEFDDFFNIKIIFI